MLFRSASAAVSTSNTVTPLYEGQDRVGHRMVDLKAGTLDEIAGSMAAYIDKAMHNEWEAVKGKPLPDPLGEEDRKILFKAIAQGVLKFLYDNRINISTTEVDGSVLHSHTLEFNVTGYQAPLP